MDAVSSLLSALKAADPEAVKQEYSVSARSSPGRKTKKQLGSQPDGAQKVSRSSEGPAASVRAAKARPPRTAAEEEENTCGRLSPRAPQKACCHHAALNMHIDQKSVCSCFLR